MRKPDDIPQDVWDAATTTYHAVLDAEPVTGHSLEIVARAILAEREANAQKADHFTTAKHVRRARELTSEQVYEIKIFARLIAAAIRKGGA